jgi:hypothetical protein
VKHETGALAVWRIGERLCGGEKPTWKAVSKRGKNRRGRPRGGYGQPYGKIRVNEGER